MKLCLASADVLQKTLYGREVLFFIYFYSKIEENKWKVIFFHLLSVFTEWQVHFFQQRTHASVCVCVLMQTALLHSETKCICGKAAFSHRKHKQLIYWVLCISVCTCLYASVCMYVCESLVHYAALCRTMSSCHCHLLIMVIKGHTNFHFTQSANVVAHISPFTDGTRKEKQKYNLWISPVISFILKKKTQNKTHRRHHGNMGWYKEFVIIVSFGHRKGPK